MLNKEEIEKAKGWLSALDISSEFEASSKEIILQYIVQLENQIKAQEMEHKYDVNIIDEVKGESVKLYKEIRQLEQENNKLNKMIDEMVKQLDELHNISDSDCFIPREYSNIDDCVKKASCFECIKQYFEKKVEEK